MTETTKPQPVRCLRPGCHRVLTAQSSIRAGYGPVCRARIRAAALLAAIKDFTAAQVEKARELISDGGLVPTSRCGVFQAVSSDGSAVYLTSAHACTCPHGLRWLLVPKCKHSIGVRILTAGKAGVTDG